MIMKNKVSCLSITLLISTLFLLHSQPSLSSTDSHFNVCLPIKCGELEISYPFYVKNPEKPFCGFPGFEVICEENGKTPYLNINSNSYVIRNIWYQNQSFQVTNSAFFSNNGCLNYPIHNLTLENTNLFNFTTTRHSRHNSVILFRNCSDEVIKENEQARVSQCPRAMAVYENDDSKLKELGMNCTSNGVVSVPCEAGEGGERMEEVLRRGVVLKWMASNCSSCEMSGGQCGYDRSVSEFKCFCSDRPHSNRCHLLPRKHTLKLIIGLGIAGGTLMLIAAVAFWYRKKLKLGISNFVTRSVSLDRSTSDLEKGSIYFGVPLFSYRELQEATDNFDESRELGDGGFGTVYYGKLRDGREVAVKRLHEKSYKRVEQFMNEVQILTCLRHPNLVSLFGCTSPNSRELLLVYEYVPNGTVADHLYGDKAKPGSLPWPVRMSIAIETARALAYLHATDIIHRDVKTNNILLDSSFNVKVADFGLSRLFPVDVTHVSTAPQGTPGYLDPEYHQCYQLTDKSDVYSFGVVLIELISSLPAVDMNRHRHEINLSNFAMNRIQQCAFDELVDLQLGFRSDLKVKKMTISVAELAFQCLQHDKEFRPSMNEVLEGLKRIESTEYEASKLEEVAKDVTKAPLSLSENGDAKLVKNHLHPASPISVMDKWGSKSSISNTSK